MFLSMAGQSMPKSLLSCSPGQSLATLATGSASSSSTSEEEEGEGCEIRAGEEREGWDTGGGEAILLVEKKIFKRET